MGTRADFYVGVGAQAKWLGSIAFDGYRIGEATKEGSYKSLDAMECWAIKSATTEVDFRRAVAKLLEINDDATTPDQGWPWPWDNSRTTDCAYCFADGQCKPFAWGREWLITVDGANDVGLPAEWPDMRGQQNVAYDRRSGYIIISG